MRQRPDRHDTRRFTVAAAAVILASAVTVLPSLDGDFVNWDDDRFVDGNPHVARLSAQNLAWAFGGLRFESYQPLHMVSYMVDGTLWPDRPLMYRAHSLLLYLIALVLLLALLKRFGFETVGAAVGALLFGLAPYHAESVAWISGRKDVLALLLVLCAWHLHLSVAGGRRRRIVLRTCAGLAFLLALLSKSAAMVAPVMFLTVDVGLRGVRPLRAVFSLVPQLLLAVGIGIGVVFLWSDSELIRPEVGVQGLDRLGLVGWSLFHYLHTTLWPFRLSPLYAEPGSNDLLIGGFGALLTIALVVAVIYAGAKRGWSMRGAVVTMILFIIGIAPFLNIVPLYYLVADRYLLFPSLSVALAGALLTNALLRLPRRDRRMIGGVGLLLVAAAWGMARVEECRFWRDSHSLWSHAVERQPDAFFTRLKLAETLRESGDPDGAARQYEVAQSIRPGSRLALTGLFWSTILADPDANNLTEEQVNQLLLRFAGSLDDARALRRLATKLREQGFERAAQVALSRGAPRPRN